MSRAHRLRSLADLVAALASRELAGGGSTARAISSSTGASTAAAAAARSPWARPAAAAAAAFAAGGLGRHLYSSPGSGATGDAAAQCHGPASVDASSLPEFDREEVAQHRTKDTRVWVTYKDGVYDVTEWVDQHPGGAARLMMAAGSAIDPFWAMYAQHNTQQVRGILETYRIGRLKGGAVAVGDPYSNEPKDRHPSLSVRSARPMNSETPLELLADAAVTPTDLFYIRNHLPVPEVDAAAYRLSIGGEGARGVELSLEDLKTRFKKHSVVATVQCAGNRRKDLLDSKLPFLLLFLFF